MRPTANIPLFANPIYLTLTAVPQQSVKIHLIQHRSEMEELCFNFVEKIDRNGLYWIKSFHSDEGPEFPSLRKIFWRMGIESNSSSAYTTQSNSAAERMNRTLTRKTKKTLHRADIHNLLWSEAIMEASHIYNSTARPTLGMKTSLRKFMVHLPTFIKYVYSDVRLTRIDTRSAEHTSSIERLRHDLT